MAQAHVVADASALIALGWVDQLEILPALFGRIIVPPAVVAEATYRGSTLPSWCHVHALGRPITARVSAARLGPGETEVISLGLELEDAWLILDDAPARALARNLELHVLGTAAVLLEAKSAGLIPLVRPILDALRARGFRLRKDIYEEVLQAAGEAQS
jgi:uncharacterized protein